MRWVGFEPTHAEHTILYAQRLGPDSATTTFNTFRHCFLIK